jgi:hypothetical protein
LLDLSPEARKRAVPQLTEAVTFISPELDKIQESLRDSEFNEKMEAFVSLKQKVPSHWEQLFDSLAIKRYLNDQDMKEYQVAF